MFSFPTLIPKKMGKQNPTKLLFYHVLSCWGLLRSTASSLFFALCVWSVWCFNCASLYALHFVAGASFFRQQTWRYVMDHLATLAIFTIQTKVSSYVWLCSLDGTYRIVCPRLIAFISEGCLYVACFFATHRFPIAKDYVFGNLAYD